ncbi:glycosyltransferase family 61 protein [Cereibacter sphaeroides]|nr:glycosyltransferase family 61 protein [Cereibacter sphaeroides]
MERTIELPADAPDTFDVSVDRLPKMTSFNNVLVQGYKRAVSPGVLWPNFETAGIHRHYRNGTPICRQPDPQNIQPAIFRGEAVFLGANGSHFGHCCGEIAPRFLQSLNECPDIPFILTGSAGLEGDSKPTPVMSAVLGWFGIDQERVQIINTPTIFEKLHVATQAEHLNGPRPSEEYLDMLDALFESKGMSATENEYVYVSRAKLSPGYGTHAGESYLCELLETLGVRVLYPERSSLVEQLMLYAGARRLIFAEGSALHGRQLLGRFPQSIDIIERRHKKMKFAINQITPRCESLNYIPAITRNLTYKTAFGEGPSFRAFSLYNVEVILDHFDSIGLKLSENWDEKAFAKAQDEAIIEWVRGIHQLSRKKHRASGSTNFLIEQLRDAGLGHLEVRVRETISG